MSRPLKVAALLAALPVAFGAAQAHAHAKLVSANPARNAAVAAPAVIRLEFSEALEPRFSTATLMKATGPGVPVKAVVQGKTVEAKPVKPLGPGGYMVMWSVVSTDGHKVEGDYNFTVK